MLNDWIRGKIPFFVRPPEDPEKPPKEGRTGEKAGVPGVEQKVRAIVVKTSFEGEDADGKGPVEKEEGKAKIGEEDEDDGESWAGEEKEVGEANSEEEKSDDESDGELAWEDVFPAAPDAAELVSEASDSETEHPAPRSSKKKGKAPVPELADEGGSDTPVRRKEACMTTNKKKVTNFFTTANVKNKNRD